VMCHQRFSNGLTEYQKKSSQMSYKTIKTLTTWQPFLFKGNFIFEIAFKKTKHHPVILN